MASVIHATGHGMVAGTAFHFGNLVPDTCGVDSDTMYYVLAEGLTADAFEFSDAVGGTPVTLDEDIADGVIRSADEYNEVADGVMDPPDAPTAPTGLAAVASSITEESGGSSPVVRLSVNAISDLTVRTVTYEVVQGTSSPNWTQATRVTMPAASPATKLPGLLGGTAYSVRAFVSSVYGVDSATTSVVTVTLPRATVVGSDVSGAVAQATEAASALLAEAMDASGLIGQITETQITDNAITAPKIKAGEIDASKLVAGIIGARELAVGNSRNLCPNNSFESFFGVLGDNLDTDAKLAAALPGWRDAARASGSAVRVQTSIPYHGSNRLDIAQGPTPANLYVGSEYIPVEPGRSYASRWFVRGSGSNVGVANAALTLRWYTPSKTLISDTAAGTKNVGSSTTYSEMTARSTVPATAAYVRLLCGNANTSGANNTVCFDYIEFYEAGYDSAGSVIVDATGVAITGGKLSVTNPGGTVIIDGTSDIFKVAYSNSVTWPARTGMGSSVTLIDLSLGLSVVPMVLGYTQIGTNQAKVTPRIVLDLNSGQITEMRDLFVEKNLTTTHVELWTYKSISGNAASMAGRIYVLVEAAL